MVLSRRFQWSANEGPETKARAVELLFGAVQLRDDKTNGEG